MLTDLKPSSEEELAWRDPRAAASPLTQGGGSVAGNEHGCQVPHQAATNTEERTVVLFTQTGLKQSNYGLKSEPNPFFRVQAKPFPIVRGVCPAGRVRSVAKRPAICPTVTSMAQTRWTTACETATRPSAPRLGSFQESRRAAKMSELRRTRCRSGKMVREHE
jgi:hypothetical protein